MTVIAADVGGSSLAGPATDPAVQVAGCAAYGVMSAIEHWLEFALVVAAAVAVALSHE